MEGVLKVLGFGSKIIYAEKAGQHQHSTANKDCNATNVTMAVTDSCGPINNSQKNSIVDGAGNLPHPEGDGSSDDTKLLKSVENSNSNLLQHSRVTSVVTVCIVQDKSSSDNKSFVMQDQDEDNISLGKINGKKKGEFCINHVIEEANKILDCDSNIDADEIEYLHNVSVMTREIKEKFKEEEQAE
eukprot:3578658-Ditylum_brightwellii.AAC.1